MDSYFRFNSNDLKKISFPNPNFQNKEFSYKKSELEKFVR